MADRNPNMLDEVHSNVSKTLSEVGDGVQNLWKSAYDHVSNTSTIQLAGEGLAVAALGTAAVLLRRPQLVKAAGAITDTETLAAELGLARLPSNTAQIGADLRYQVSLGESARNVTVHLPPGFSPDKPTSVYYLLDGVQVNNPAGNMLGINGWARTADAKNFVAVNLEQSPQSALKIWGMPLPSSLLGKPIPNVTSWSFDHGLLNSTKGIDDVRLFESVHQRLQQAMTVKSNNIVTFSDGAPLANKIAGYMPEGSINGVANVAGTILKDAPLPKPGIKAFFVNSRHDPTIPIEGGAGPQLTKWMPRLGQRNVLKSAPELQEVRFAEANAIQTPARVTETPMYTQRDYVTPGTNIAMIRSFRLNKGGHTWPGRDVGEGTSTAFTKANGDTVSHAEFPTNKWIVDFLEGRVQVQRTLSATN